MKICIVSAPLTARSGVYRSTYDLVEAARSRGLDWSAVIAMRPSSAGVAPTGVVGVHETVIEQHGLSLVPAIERLLLSRPEVVDADVIITMIGQSDVAMKRLNHRLPGLWISFVRGLPWPARGEASLTRRMLQRALVGSAMRAADELWVTTSVLGEAVEHVRKPHIIPAGIPLSERTSWGELAANGHAVFAGRLDIDKRPEFFSDLIGRIGVSGRIYGRGPLEDQLRRSQPQNVELCGWASPDELWADASVFVGTSQREAFGRSAVEAAMRGVPVILSQDYGAAPFLITDPTLARKFILSPGPIALWEGALRELYSDSKLRSTLSNHVRANALKLSIDSSVDRIVERADTLVNR